MSVDSAPSLGVYYFLSLTLSVCPSVTLLLQIDSSFFVSQWNRAIFGHHVSIWWHSIKRCSLIVDLGPLTPKIYSPILLAITLHYQVANRGRALGSSKLLPRGNSLNFGANHCCHGNDILARRGVQTTPTGLSVCLSVIPLAPSAVLGCGPRPRC